MKCPFCKKELKLIGEKSDSGYPIDEYFCGCPKTAFHFGNTPMWNELRVLHNDLEEKRECCKRAEKELERTRKALDVAQKAMLEIHYQAPSIKVADKILTEALEQITALEQKDK